MGIDVIGKVKEAFSTPRKPEPPPPPPSVAQKSAQPKPTGANSGERAGKPAEQAGKPAEQPFSKISTLDKVSLSKDLHNEEEGHDVSPLLAALSQQLDKPGSILPQEQQPSDSFDDLDAVRQKTFESLDLSTAQKSEKSYTRDGARVTEVEYRLADGRTQSESTVEKDGYAVHTVEQKSLDSDGNGIVARHEEVSDSRHPDQLLSVKDGVDVTSRGPEGERLTLSGQKTVADSHEEIRTGNTVQQGPRTSTETKITLDGQHVRDEKNTVVSGVSKDDPALRQENPAHRKPEIVEQVRGDRVDYASREVTHYDPSGKCTPYTESTEVLTDQLDGAKTGNTIIRQDSGRSENGRDQVNWTVVRMSEGGHHMDAQTVVQGTNLSSETHATWHDDATVDWHSTTTAQRDGKPVILSQVDEQRHLGDPANAQNALLADTLTPVKSGVDVPNKIGSATSRLKGVDDPNLPGGMRGMKGASGALGTLIGVSQAAQGPTELDVAAGGFKTAKGALDVAEALHPCEFGGFAGKILGPAVGIINVAEGARQLQQGDAVNGSLTLGQGVLDVTVPALEVAASLAGEGTATAATLSAAAGVATIAGVALAVVGIAYYCYCEDQARLHTEPITI